MGDEAKERIVVSGGDLEVLTKGKPAPKDEMSSAPAADKPTDEKPTEAPTGKSLGEAVSHTYAASAPAQASWRSSVAHAVDAAYGDTDPDVVVKSTRSLIETVYGAGDDDAAAVDPGARDLS